MPKVTKSPKNQTLYSKVTKSAKTSSLVHMFVMCWKIIFLSNEPPRGLHWAVIIILSARCFTKPVEIHKITTRGSKLPRSSDFRSEIH